MDALGKSLSFTIRRLLRFRERTRSAAARRGSRGSERSPFLRRRQRVQRRPGRRGFHRRPGFRRPFYPLRACGGSGGLGTSGKPRGSGSAGQGRHAVPSRGSRPYACRRSPCQFCPWDHGPPFVFAHSRTPRGNIPGPQFQAKLNSGRCPRKYRNISFNGKSDPAQLRRG